MKTKINIIYLLVAVSILVFTGCKGKDGLDGEGATVYYSEWITPSAWLGNSGDWYFNVDAPDLKADIVESGVILAYVSLNGDVYESKAVRPLPAYAVGANWDFLIPDYEIIEFTSDMSSRPFTTGNLFRFIAIPGNIKTLKSASLENISEKELRSMPYKDVCKLFNIPE
ncbi:MAG: hypothetical protein Q7J86_03120 [Bacteroidota bacterium]|nr:hypothetical protein [Bacteroidota bacterium]MDO9613499.1 hypothetical protein [Bacteroidota bacterium]